MKKRICLLLSVILILTSLISCAEETDDTAAYDRYVSALTLYDAGYEAHVNFQMTVEDQRAAGEFHVKVSGEDCSIERKNSTDARYYVDGVAYRRGYFVGDVYYTDSTDASAKIKESVTRDDFAAECASFFCINPFVSNFPTLTKEDLASANHSVNGKKTAFSLSIDAEMIKTYLANDDVTVSDGVMTAAFDEIGDMEALTLYLAVTMNGQSTILEITYNFLNRGAVPAVLEPQNANAYIEV